MGKCDISPFLASGDYCFGAVVGDSSPGAVGSDLDQPRVQPIDKGDYSGSLVLNVKIEPDQDNGQRPA